METNEAVKKTLLSLAETGVETPIASLQEVKEGDLQALEQQHLTQALALGYALLEGVLSQQATVLGSAARRMGTCGHRRRVVGIRPRQVLTVPGEVTIRRASYRCLGTHEQDEQREKNRRVHGEAPFESSW